MREGLTIMWLLEEAKQHGIPVLNAKPSVHTGPLLVSHAPKCYTKPTILFTTLYEHNYTILYYQ
jgi:hypothetical protein